MSLISVIVPVYNVEKYIRETLDRIVSQTYRNIEIILVDDGSIDASGSICEEYARKDSRIKLVYQKNAGEAMARNKGLDLATGDYCVFVDSDDLISLDHVEFLYSLLKKYDSDIAMCAFEHKNEIRCADQPEKSLEGADAFKYFLETRRYSVCMRICKMSLIQDMRFISSFRGADACFSARLMVKVKKIAISPEVKYFYRRVDTGATYGMFKIKELETLEVAQKLIDITQATYPEFTQLAEKKYMTILSGLIVKIVRQRGFFKDFKCRNSALNTIRDILKRKTSGLKRVEIKHYSVLNLPTILLPIDFRISCMIARIVYFLRRS